MFYDRISETPFSKRFADDMFPNITCEDFNGDVTLKTVLRIVFSEKLADGETLSGKFIEVSPEKEYIEAHSAGDVINNYVSTRNFPKNAFTIVNIRDRDYVGRANANAFMDFLEANFCGEREGKAASFERVPLVDSFFSSMTDKEGKPIARTFSAVCVKDKRSVLFVDDLDTYILHMAIAGIGCFFPWYFPDRKDLVSCETVWDVMRSLGDINTIGPDESKIKQSFLRCVNKYAEKYDFRTPEIKTVLGGFETQFLRQSLQGLQRKVDDKKSAMKQKNLEAAELYKQMRDLQVQLEGTRAAIESGEKSTGIMDYFIHNKNTGIIRVDGDKLEFTTKAYLSLFDEESAERVINNKRADMYRYVDDKEEAARLLRAIFIDQELKVRYCSAYKIELSRARVTCFRGYNYGDAFKGYMPNTHIDRFECMGNYERIIAEYLQDGNYLNALENCMASTGSLNFNDNPVISEFVRRLFDKSYTYRECIELPNGDVVDATEAIKYLKEQKEPKQGAAEPSAQQA